jgi:ABC-type nitrate/sulfonate/bicarbonate transport system permease component
MSVLAAEMIASKVGLGFLVSRGMDYYDVPLILVGMLTIGIVGALLAVITAFRSIGDKLWVFQFTRRQ